MTRLTGDGAAAAYASPSVSRDGSVLAFLRGGTPYRGGARGAGAARLLDTEDARELAVSADGGTVAVRAVGERDDGGFAPVLESRVGLVGALARACGRRSGRGRRARLGRG